MDYYSRKDINKAHDSALSILTHCEAALKVYILQHHRGKYIILFVFLIG